MGSRARLSCLLCVFLLAGLFTACSDFTLPGTKLPSSTRPAQADILAGLHLGLTGPTSEESLAYRQGLEAQINDINAKGGIGGAKIRLRVEDDAGQPQKAIASAHRLVEESKAAVLLGSNSVATTNAVLPYVAEKSVPLLFPMVALSSIYEPPRQSVFSVLPDTDRQTRLAISYMLETLKPKKIGLLWVEADGGKQVADGARALLAAKRVLVSADIPIQAGTVADFAPVVQMLRRSQPDAIVALIPAGDALPFLQAKKRAGWDVPVVGHTSMAATSIAKAGSDVEGVFGISATAMAAEKDLADVAGLVKATSPEAVVSSSTIYGIGVARLLQKVLAAAGDVQKFAAVVAGAESLRNVDVKVFPSVAFGPGQRLGVDKLAVTQVRAGQIVRVSDWLPVPPRN